MKDKKKRKRESERVSDIRKERQSAAHIRIKCKALHEIGSRSAVERGERDREGQ